MRSGALSRVSLEATPKELVFTVTITLVKAAVPKLLWVETHLQISWESRDPLNKIEYRVLKFALKIVMDIY